MVIDYLPRAGGNLFSRVFMEKTETIPQIIRANRDKWGRRTAMCMKMFGVWHRYTWQDYYDKVKYFSLGLISLGLQRGDVACIIGDNEPPWFWGEFAVQAAGGIATGAFVDSIPSEVKYVAEHSDAQVRHRQRPGADRQVPRN